MSPENWHAWERRLHQTFIHLARDNGGRHLHHVRSIWRFYLDRLLDPELGCKQFVALSFFLDFLALVVRKLHGMITEDAALLFLIARKEFWCDIRVRVCYHRSDSSLMARHIWTQIVFIMADFRVLSICNSCIILGRRMNTLPISNWWLTYTSILRGHGFEEGVWRLNFLVSNLELTNVTRYRLLCTFAMHRYILVTML